MESHSRMVPKVPNTTVQPPLRLPGLERQVSLWFRFLNCLCCSDTDASCLLSSSWLERNVPVYYSQVLTVLGPNLRLVWTKTNETAVYVSGKCSSQISWVKDNLPWFTEWVRKNLH